MAIQWSNWASLGKPHDTELSHPFAQQNQDGRLEVFATSQGAIFNIWQVAPNGGWADGWQDKGIPQVNITHLTHVVGRNADDRQEIFALGDNGVLFQKWQVAPNDGWSDWKSMGTPAVGLIFTGQFTAGRNQDGRQELFAEASDGNIWQIWQTAPNGGWSGWKQTGKPPAGFRATDRITVGSNADGRQELFIMGGDDAVWHIWQLAANVGWGAWESLGKPRDVTFPEPKDRDVSEPLVRKNADGHLEVFSPGNGAFCNRWQEAPNSHVWRHEGWNAKPRPAEGVNIVWLESALNFNNRLEVHVLGDDGALWHAWQVDQAPFWSAWARLDSPPPGIRAADRLTIGTNQDGRLEVFVVGQEGAVWHIWQVR